MDSPHYLETSLLILWRSHNQPHINRSITIAQFFVFEVAGTMSLIREDAVQDSAIQANAQDYASINGGSTNGLNSHASKLPPGLSMPINDPDMTVATNSQGYMDIEAVQKVLNRSRASVYRYANTDPDVLDAEWNPKRLNPEKREHKDDPLKFHPSEVARFAREVLGIKNVRIEQREPEETVTQSLLRQILVELQQIRQALEDQQSR